MSSFSFLMTTMAALFLCTPVVEALPQDAASPKSPQEGVVLTKLRQPFYPPLARQTRIGGDVQVMLRIRQDGSVESATVVSGHPLLQQAALDSAQQSQFECPKCSDAVTSYQMIYTFQLVQLTATEVDTKNKQQDQPYPHVTQLQNRVTVVDQVVCICDPAPDSLKVRSIKCLYLWKCGFR